MTDYSAMLQRVQAQIRSLELTEEQIFDQMQPLKTQERTLLGILRALEEQKADFAEKQATDKVPDISGQVVPMPREAISKIDDKAITPAGNDVKKKDQESAAEETENPNESRGENG